MQALQPHFMLPSKGSPSEVLLCLQRRRSGIGIQAIGLTFGILASLLFCYKTGIIKPTENFNDGNYGNRSENLFTRVSFLCDISGIGFIHSTG